MSPRIWLPCMLSLVLCACGSTLPRRDPTGQVFPSVQGKSLGGKTYSIPDDFQGAPVILLVGYVQNAQFDIDRWLLGIAQAGLNVRVHELPTIPGLVPGMFAGTIDAGMRSGIPEEDWGAVITIYETGERVVEFTGNEKPRNGRVLLLDSEGKVVFFHDRGYSAGTLLALAKKLGALVAPPAPGG